MPLLTIFLSETSFYNVFNEYLKDLYNYQTYHALHFIYFPSITF